MYTDEIRVKDCMKMSKFTTMAATMPFISIFTLPSDRIDVEKSIGSVNDEFI